MGKQDIGPFSIIGITVRTSNQNGEAANDIPALWGRFYSESILSKIPGKINEEIYSVYTDYAGDYTKPYTTLIGCRVNSLDKIPEGMVGVTVNKGSYFHMVVKGDLMKGIVIEGWQKIWNTELNRTYLADFEVYGDKSKNPEDAEVEIYVGIR